MFRCKPEEELQSKEPIYARLLRTAKAPTEEAASVSDVLLHGLRGVCDCTQWPFAYARILSQDDALDSRGVKEVWHVPFLDPHGFRNKAIRMNRLRSGVDWHLRMVSTARPTLLRDLEHELDLSGQHAARELGLRSALGMPVIAGENIKAVCVFFSGVSIQQDALFEEVFAAVGAALGHFIELQRCQERLREITGRLMTLQDDERRRLARELHDTTGQNLSAIVINIELLGREQSLSPAVRAKLAECADLARGSLQEVRTFSYVLHPPMLEELATQAFWDDLYAAHATLVLNGHDHGYERLAPQTNTGELDMRHGVREFVIGTGGKSLFGPGKVRAANSEVYDITTLGVSLFTLHGRSYEWTFYREPVDGNGIFIDHGSARCNAPREDHTQAAQ